METEERPRRKLRALNVPINASTYNRVNAARVAAELSWRDVLECALGAWLAKDGEVRS